jgi:hypothetical protein
VRGAAILLLALAATAATAQEWTVRPEAALESRLFPRTPAFDDQLRAFQGGLILGGEAVWRNADRDVALRLQPYVRLDTADSRRTYADLREAHVAVSRGDWELLAGFSRVFWGVAESRNVTDVVNQTDALEDVDDDEKLGQPMLRLSRRIGGGVVEAYWLPVFRERGFPGRDGRLRTEPVVDRNAARYARGGDEFAGDFALRYAGRFGAFDVGLHGFYGTSRAPRLDFDAGSGRLTPFYQRLAQTGIDLQYTAGPWLLKAEVVGADIGGDRFAASVAGFEYTFFDLRGTGFDLGVIGEHLYDGRSQTRSPATPFDNDAFAGLRLTLNDVQDTEFLGGAIVDLDRGAVQASAEFQRRIGDRMLLEVEGRAFAARGDPLLRPLQRDHVLTLRLTRYF